MEQIGLFITERSSWIFMGAAVLVLIFLTDTLHRIKQCVKQMKKLTEAVKNIRSELDWAREPYIKMSQENTLIPDPETVEEKKHLMQAADTWKPNEENQPEALLREVLEEVFP